MLGNTVEVRAQLTNARLDPLDVPSVNLQVIQPDGARADRAAAGRPKPRGTLLGQLPALQEGTYRLELPVPESDHQSLTRRIQVKVPDLERENPRRNDALLSAIASGTGGKYYVGIRKAIARRAERAGPQLKDRTSTVILTGCSEPPVGRDLAPLDDGCVVRFALFGVADTKNREIGVICLAAEGTSASETTADVPSAC